MRRVVALLAAVLALGLAACGDDGAEPGASQEATLVLDFTPNAVHAGIYHAQATGEFAKRGVDLQIREPSASSDAPKLLEAGRADFAVMDIQDLAIARERGLDVVAVTPIVNRPLAAVIAREGIAEPSDLAGRTVGVTGLPSDDAVLATVLAAGGLKPDSVKRVTIGFQAVAALAAGRIDAATAFRNAEGIELRRQEIPVHIFPVERFGAPPFPELVLTTRRQTLDRDPGLVTAVVAAIHHGSTQARRDPGRALRDLIVANPGLDRASQHAQLRAVVDSLGGSFDTEVLEQWSRWTSDHGIVKSPPDIERAFALGG